MFVNLYGTVEEVNDLESEPRQEALAKVRALEGRHVHIALSDGSRIDDCQLVSACRRSVQTVWVFSNGTDAFVPLTEIIDAWEATPSRRRAA
jgi:hypothetical protein